MEKNIETTLAIGDLSVRMKGKADRIEAWQHGWAVVDLKSGSFQPSELKVKTLEELLDPKKGKALQLFTYAWLLSTQQAGGPFRAGIAAMRKPRDPVAWLTYQGDAWIRTETIAEFEQCVLRPLIEQILDPSQPFAAPDFLGDEEEN